MYTALSKFYDRLMADAEYDEWADYVAGLIGDRDDGADLACGSGAFTLRLIERGKKTFGVDLSPGMLSAAAANAARRGIKALFVQGDMTAFSPPHKLGFVTCMCDGVNYVREPSPFFRAVYDSLKPGGVFVFDISTPYKLTEVIGNNTFTFEDGDLTYIWHNVCRNGFVDMELTFFEREGDRYRKSRETQRQYFHSVGDLTERLASAGFAARAYGDRTLSPPGKREQRAHFAAIKG